MAFVGSWGWTLLADTHTHTLGCGFSRRVENQPHLVVIVRSNFNRQYGSAVSVYDSVSGADRLRVNKYSAEEKRLLVLGLDPLL